MDDAPEDPLLARTAEALMAYLRDCQDSGETVSYRPIDMLGGDIRIAERPHFSGYLTACDLVRAFAEADSRQIRPSEITALSKAAETRAAVTLGLK